MPKRFEGPFSRFIRKRRRALRRTQKTIADWVGVTPDFLSLVESGARRIDLDKLPLLADALEVERMTFCRRALADRAPRLSQALFEKSPD